MVDFESESERARELSEPAGPKEVAWSLNNFGQVLKASDQVGFEVPPYLVSLPPDSRLGGDLNRLLRGEEVGAEQVPLRERFRERIAAVAVNDIGEIMLPKIHERGGFLDVAPKPGGDIEKVLKLQLPPGWRTVGLAQSHQIADRLYSVLTPYAPRLERSGLFYLDFLNFAEYFTRYDQVQSYFVTTPRYTAVMVATKDTKDLASQFLDEHKDLMEYPTDYRYYLRNPREIVGFLRQLRREREKYEKKHRESVILDSRFRKDLTEMKIVYYQQTKSRRKVEPFLSRLN